MVDDVFAFLPQQRKLMGSSAQEQLRCALVQAPGQVQRGSGEGSEGSREGLGCFGAEPGSGEGLGGFGAEAWSGSTGSGEGFRRRFQEALVQNQGGFGAEPGQVWTGFRRRFRRRSGRLWCRARLGSTGFRRRFRRRFREALVQSQVRFNRVPKKVWGSFGARWGVFSPWLRSTPQKDL